MVGFKTDQKFKKFSKYFEKKNYSFFQKKITTKKKRSKKKRKKKIRKKNYSFLTGGSLVIIRLP